MLILSLIFGCDDHEFTGGHHSGGETTGEGYTAVQSVFSNNCTNCHATGATFPSLDGDLCTDLVDVESQQSSNKLVVVGDSDASYLYHKMAGTHLDVGGNGSQMPIGGSISQEDIDLVGTWIDEGALCNETSEPVSDPSDETSSEPSDDSGEPEPSSEASSEPSSEASSEPAGEPSGEPVGDAANGESLVNSKCMGCHASNPAIGDASNMTDDELINLFDNGQGYMPPQNLTEQEKLDVIAYLRQEYGSN